MKGSRTSSGTCALCGTSSIPKRSIEKHLDTCLKRNVATGEKFFHLLVSDPYDPRYWLHVEAAESATISNVDSFLRDTWVECCGHLSEFSIGGPKRKLKDVLAMGKQFSYEYDFGSTTELALRVVSQGTPKTSHAGAVRLLARNDALLFPCRTCGRLATVICLECQEEIEGPEDEGRQFYCHVCIDKPAHSHDEDMRSPVVNSPRMGVCAYPG